MKPRQLVPLVFLLPACLMLRLAGHAVGQEDTNPRPYDGSWQSLQKMPVPAWFDDGKIGIFIHWGPYSVIGHRKGDRGYAEHVPKMLYDDPAHYYPFGSVVLTGLEDAFT